MRHSDCKMNPEFDFCVIRAFVIIYLLLRVFVCPRSCLSLLCEAASVCVCVGGSLNLGCFPTYFCFVFLVLFPVGSHDQLFQGHSDTTRCPPSPFPSSSPFNNIIKSNAQSVFIGKGLCETTPSRPASTEVVYKPHYT